MRKFLILCLLLSVPFSLLAQASAPVKAGDAVETKEKSEDESKKEPVVAYLDIEYVFKNHPWTLHTKQTFKEEIDQRTSEIAQIQDELENVKRELPLLRQRLLELTPFYHTVIFPDEIYLLPITVEDNTTELNNLINATIYTGVEELYDSPMDKNLILQEVKDKITFNKNLIKEKEDYINLRRATSVEQIKEKETTEVEEILQDIYSELKLYCLKRNVSAVVNKKEILFGQQPTDITMDFADRLKKTRKNKPKKK
ncbi:hypothetical protein Dip518_000778 [Parelusimicrobium proximum]|uniref:hypothetical protein n=1 Tax=Parelusimicrobium proximum TaxID=3228953 RepID=UPI003D176931